MKLFNKKNLNICFDRNELSGAFGDIGTTLPLLIAVCGCCEIDIRRIFILFGIMQIFTGFVYGIPVAVQPLKMMSMMVITKKVPFELMVTAGLVTGILMTLLAITGTLNKISKIFPECIIRGVQLGLGISFATISLKEYIVPSGFYGYLTSFVCFIIGILLIGNRKYPPIFFLMIIGIIYSLLCNLDEIPFNKMSRNKSIFYPLFYIPSSMEEIFNSLIFLSIPQLSLSISNSILATRRLIKDLYPNLLVDEKKIGITYGLMNISTSLLGGVPVCHGAGGMAGHYNFGARTGGAIIIAGLVMITTGSLGGNIVNHMLIFFPKTILGIILFFESITLMSYIKNCFTKDEEVKVILITAMLSNALPYGYIIGIIAGFLFYYLKIRKNNFSKRKKEHNF